ncbi:hypothetical protein B0H13DRAFT_1113939 [Mycena leptocephala]|nr:hypothetical protein B0H13DRAFT_1113939 [Mycena leptocephala]
MLFTTHILTAVPFASMSFAAPSSAAKLTPVCNLSARIFCAADNRRKLADPIIIVCVESNPPMGCVDIPPTPEICINFIGSSLASSTSG